MLLHVTADVARLDAFCASLDGAAATLLPLFGSTGTVAAPRLMRFSQPPLFFRSTCSSLTRSPRFSRTLSRARRHPPPISFSFCPATPRVLPPLPYSLPLSRCRATVVVLRFRAHRFSIIIYIEINIFDRFAYRDYCARAAGIDITFIEIIQVEVRFCCDLAAYRRLTKFGCLMVVSTPTLRFSLLACSYLLRSPCGSDESDLSDDSV